MSENEWRRVSGETDAEYAARIRERLSVIVGIVLLEVGQSEDFDDLLDELDRIVEQYEDGHGIERNRLRSSIRKSLLNITDLGALKRIDDLVMMEERASRADAQKILRILRDIEDGDES